MAILATHPPQQSAPDPALAITVSDTLARCRNCAQASFAVLQQEFDFEGGAILKALTPFPGLALRGETCGAVTGCLMAIGAVHGRETLDDWNGYVRSLQPARTFCSRFEDEVGSTQCAEILEQTLGRRFDLATRSGSEEYLAAGGRRACSLVVVRAVAIAAEILRETRPTVAPAATPASAPAPPRPVSPTRLASAYDAVRRAARRITRLASP